MRAETGTIEFENDWRGVFIRGDDALMKYKPLLIAMRKKLSPKDAEMFDFLGLSDLVKLLENTNHHIENPNVQTMKTFEECKK